MFIKANWLNELYKEGKLNKVLTKYNKLINKSSLLGSGTQVCCFGTNHKRRVIKLCPKKIRFFTEPSFISFKDEINSMKPFFTEVLEIIYEDNNVFIYTQNTCHKIKKNKAHDPYVIMSVSLLIIAMLKYNKIVTDIGPHNIGVYHRNISIFDCHGLQKVTHIMNIANWYTRLLINLEKYISVDYIDSINIIDKLETLFINKNINEAIEIISKEIFDVVYRKYSCVLSNKKLSIINDKVGILGDTRSSNHHA
jgi:hypothetical protein